jgi:hypothetical protein
MNIKALTTRILATFVCLNAMGGCTAPSVTTSLGDRWVTGKSASFLSFAALADHAITLGGKTVRVTSGNVAWEGGGVLKLPATWKRMEVDEVSDGLVIIVDGNKLATIHPTA